MIDSEMSAAPWPYKERSALAGLSIAASSLIWRLSILKRVVDGKMVDRLSCSHCSSRDVWRSHLLSLFSLYALRYSVLEVYPTSLAGGSRMVIGALAMQFSSSQRCPPPAKD